LTWGSGPQQLLKDFPNVGFTGDRLYAPVFIDNEWAPWEGAVMAIDPSGRGKDETGYAVVKQLHGTLFCTAVGGLLGGYDEPTLRALALIAKNHSVKHIIIEANFGDGMYTQIFQQVLRKEYPCLTEEVKHNIQKEKRIIDVLEPVMNRHRLVCDETALRSDLNYSDVSYSLLYQLTHITRDRDSLKHDDRLDALAMAVGYWVESMAKDEKTSYDQWKTRELDRELQEFVYHCKGLKNTQGKSWVPVRSA
jgi:hypothetical protein